MRAKALSTVHNLAKSDPRILFIGSDLGAGTLHEMRKELPNQFFMEGISEQHIIGFTAGLAKEGFVPYVNTIGTFFYRRAYEQICIDLGLHRLPVRLLASGGGMVYAPLGPTHTSIEDFSLMLSIPNMKVFAPADAHEMEMLLKASVNDTYPYYIRFGKGGEKIVTGDYQTFDFNPKEFGSVESEAVIFTTGVMLQQCLEAQDILKSRRMNCKVIHFPYLNNLKLPEIITNIKRDAILLCVEEHIPRGGLLTQLLHESMQLDKPLKNCHQIALSFSFSHNYGSQLDHLEFNGLTGSKIAEKIEFLLHKM